MREVYKRLKITPIFNVPYSPDFNGIESYFSLVKGEYKKLLLRSLIKEDTFDVKELIEASIKSVSNDKV